MYSHVRRNSFIQQLSSTSATRFTACNRETHYTVYSMGIWATFSYRCGATTVSAAAEAAAALRHRRGNFLPTPKSMVVAAINSPWRSTCDRSNEQVGRERLLLAMLPYGTHTWFVVVDSEHTFRGRKHSKLLRGCCYAISRLLRTAPSTGLDGSSTPIDKICHARSCCCSSP